MTSDIVLHPDDRLELQMGDQSVVISAPGGGRVNVDIPGGHVRADRLEVDRVDATRHVGTRVLRAEHVLGDWVRVDKVKAHTALEVGHGDVDTQQPGRMVVRGSDGEAEAIVLDGADTALDVGPGGVLRLGIGASIVRRFFRQPDVEDLDLDVPGFDGSRDGRFGRFGDDGGDDEPQWEEVDLFDQLDALEREVADLRDQVAALQ